MLIDAHLHLQDVRLDGVRPQMAKLIESENIRQLVVNGTREGDWGKVIDCADSFSQVIPSFGLHPWWLNERSSNWLHHLEEHLMAFPAAVGEIGLDCWFRKDNIEEQEEVFLLHSYSGPVEMIQEWVAMGARFSISGYFAHPRKASRKKVFEQIPFDRLLIETDAPDMHLPELLQTHHGGVDHKNAPVNHPGNLRSVYRFVSDWLGCSMDELEAQTESNYDRMFHGASGAV